MEILTNITTALQTVSNAMTILILLSVYMVFIYFMLLPDRKNIKPATRKCGACSHFLVDYDRNLFGPHCSLDKDMKCSYPDFKHFKQIGRDNKWNGTPINESKVLNDIGA